MEKLQNINNKILITPKLLYFSIATVFYALHQVRNTFITSQFGISNGDFGIFISIVQCIAFITNLWIAALNDKFGRQKHILVTTLLICAICFQGFFLSENKLLFFGLYTIYFCLLSLTTPLLDKVILEFLNSTPGVNSEAYGKQRVWGSLGYLSTNFIIDKITIDTKNDKDFSALPIFNAVVTAIAISLVVLYVQNLPSQNTSTNYLSSMGHLFKNFDFMYFIFIILLCGIVRATMTNYLYFYYTHVMNFKDGESPYETFWPLSYALDFFFNHKKATTTMFGVVLEILIFLNSKRIIEKFGLFWPLFIAQIAQLLRFISYYYMDYTHPDAFLYSCFTELLKGLNFSLTQCSAAILVNKLAPRELKTTAQVIYTGSFIALGTVLSGLISKPILVSGDKAPVEDIHEEFLMLFLVNIIVSVVILVFFLAKYAFSENLLFNRANAERKLQEIEDKNNREYEERMAKEEAVNEDVVKEGEKIDVK